MLVQQQHALETEETCTQNNMLKIARYLFRWTGNVTYADYYERALINGLLGTQRMPAPDQPSLLPSALPQQLKLSQKPLQLHTAALSAGSSAEQASQQHQQQQQKEQTKHLEQVSEPAGMSRYAKILKLSLYFQQDEVGAACDCLISGD